jgi:two-component system response regulator GlrR
LYRIPHSSIGKEAPLPRLLVIDDDPDILRVVTAAFSLDGFGVREAPSLPVALSLLQDQSFDVILTDSFGASLVEWVSELEKLRLAAAGTPIILVTARVENLRLRPSNFGLSGIILKPFDVQHLTLAVRAALDRPPP